MPADRFHNPLDEADRKARYGRPVRQVWRGGAGNGLIASTAPVLDPTDEGGLEIELMATMPALYSTWMRNRP